MLLLVLQFDLGGVITWLPAGNVELVESYATWPGDEDFVVGENSRTG